MKKVILSSVLAAAAMVSVNANAAVVSFCSGGVAGAGAAATTAATAFVKVGFSPKCSANVHLAGDDGGSYYRVGAGSLKGKNKFAGSSAGGAVSAVGTCAAVTGCVASDATGAVTSASST